MSKKKWVAGGVAGVLLTLTLIAAAGAKYSYEVSLGSNWASGSLGSARASTDPYQFIGCQSYGSYGWCEAADGGSAYTSCYWTSASHAAVVHSIGPESYIYFDSDGSGNCQNIFVSNYSFYLPATP